MARRQLEETQRAVAGVTIDGKETSFKTVCSLKDVKMDRQYSGVFSMQYNFDGTQVCAGLSGGGIRMFNSKTGALIRDLIPNRHGGFGVMCMRYHPKDVKMMYAGTSEGNVFLINTETAESNRIISEPHNQINALDFSVDGFNFCTSGKDLAVRVYETKSGKLFKTYEGFGNNPAARANQDVEAGNTMRVYALKFHPENENIFITAGWDNHIKIWDIRTNDGIKRQIHGPHVCGDSLDIKDRNILSGSWVANHALQEWDYGEGRKVRDINFPNTNGAFLYCAQYGDLGTVLAGGSGTNSVQVIEAATDKVIGSVAFDHPVQAMDSSMGGRFFAAGGGGTMIKFSAMK